MQSLTCVLCMNIYRKILRAKSITKKSQHNFILNENGACIKIASKTRQIISQSYDGPLPCLLMRYIDDIVGATSFPLNQLQDFINFVNNFPYFFLYLWFFLFFRYYPICFVLFTIMVFLRHILCLFLLAFS